MMFPICMYVLLALADNPLDPVREVAADFQVADTRGASLLAREYHELEGFDRRQSAGVFVGIREFTKDNAIAEVPYAVDDAVDLAHLFSLELGLIPPDQVRLVLSGEPGKTKSEERLEALKAKGVQILDASTADVLAAVHDAAESAGRDGFFVVSLATHGYTVGDHYLLSRGSSLDFVADTGIRTELIVSQVNRATSSRALVLVDACKARLRAGSRADAPPDEESKYSTALQSALSKVRGKAVLKAAREGEHAYDDMDLGNGVFSRAVLDGLRCGASTDERGLITIGSLCTFVNQRVEAWQAENRSKKIVENPGIDCNSGGWARNLPLALCGAGTPEPVTFDAEKGDVIVVVDLAAKTIETTRKEEVDFKNDDHPNLFRTYRRGYATTFEPEPGFRIINAELTQHSSARVDNLHLTIAQDKRSASLSFDLTSGPAVDTYAGWLWGSVVLTEQMVIEATRSSFPVELDFTRFGRYELSEIEAGDLSRIESVTILSAGGALLAHGKFGETLLVVDDRYQLRILAVEGQLVLEMFSHLGDDSSTE